MFDLTFLGTSAKLPSANRNHPGLLVEVGGHRIMIDCGEGTNSKSEKNRLGRPLSVSRPGTDIRTKASYLIFEF
jgi:ribonuclease BN (tRNA processing enzyme)